MRRLRAHLQLELTQCVITIGKKRHLLIHLQALRVQHLIQASLRLGVVIRLYKSKTFVPRGRVLFTLAKAQRTLAHNDLEVALLVHPVTYVASVNAYLQGSLRQWEEAPITGIAFDKTRLFVPQLRFQSLGHLERVIPHGFDVQGAIKRQKVLESIETHAIGDERGPLGFHIQQLRGDRLGQQPRQGAKGPGLAPGAVAMLQPRTVELKRAKQGAKRAPRASFQGQRRPAVWAIRARVEKGGDLLLEEVPLQGAKELFGLRQGQPEMLDALIVLVEGDEIGDGLFLTLIVTHDELQFDTHTGASPGSSDR